MKLFRSLMLTCVCLVSTSTVYAQTLPPDVIDLLKTIKAAGDKAATLITPTPPPPTNLTLTPKTTAEFQDAVLKAPNDATILLMAGTKYGSVFLPLAPRGRKLTIMTQGWNWTTPGPVPRSALSNMAVIKADDRQGYGFWTMQSDITLKGIAFVANDPSGQGEMLRLGDATDPDITHTPRGINVIQCLFLGSTVGETPTGTSTYGQKRAIALNSADTVIDQIRCEDVFIAGQDSQCIAIFSSPGNIMVKNSFLSSASEPMIIGGTPPAGPEFVPDNVTFADGVLWHPLKWKGREPAAVVKNLFEVKFGTHINLLRSLLVNHWVQAQPGYGIVLTMASNGPCSYCKMGPTLVEDTVMVNVSAGVNITGFQYSYAPGSGQATDFTIHNNIIVTNTAVMGGNGRPLQMGNEPKNVTWDHNTSLHQGNSFVNADYGTKWPFQSPALTAAIAAGPVQGFRYTNNLTYYGSYGIFAAGAAHAGNLSTYFPGAQVGGNIFGGTVPATALTIMNAAAGAAGPNTVTTVANFDAMLVNRTNALVDASGACVKTYAGKGADCSRLQSVFALQKFIPAEPVQMVGVGKLGRPNPDKKKPEHDRTFLTPGMPLDPDAADGSEICAEMPDGPPQCFGTVEQTRGKKPAKVTPKKTTKKIT